MPINGVPNWKFIYGKKKQKVSKKFGIYEMASNLWEFWLICLKKCNQYSGVVNFSLSVKLIILNELKPK